MHIMCMQMSTAIIEKQIVFNIWKTVHDNNHENGVYAYVSSFPFVWGDRGAARNFFTVLSDSLVHPPLSLVFFFQSYPLLSLIFDNGGPHLHTHNMHIILQHFK